MIITNKIFKEWNPVLLDLGPTAFANGTGLNFRTVKRILKEKRCKDEYYDKIQAFVEKRKKVVQSKLEAADQD